MRSLVSCGLLLSICFLMSASASHSVRPDDKPTASHRVMKVLQISRGEGDRELVEKLTELQAKVDAAATPAVAKRYARQIERVTERLDATRSYALDGWTAEARGDGTPVSSMRSQGLFFIDASAKVNRLLRDVQDDLFVIVPTGEIHDLFVVEGRRCAKVKSIQRVEVEAHWSSTNSKRLPPVDPDPSGVPEAEIRLLTPKARDKDGKVQYRGSLVFKIPKSTTSARVFQVWGSVFVETTAGETIGPIPFFAEWMDKKGKGISVSRSWELIQLPGGPRIREAATRLHIIDTRWSNRMSS
jgi:hypothetical protein